MNDRAAHAFEVRSSCRIIAIVIIGGKDMASNFTHALFINDGRLFNLAISAAPLPSVQRVLYPHTCTCTVECQRKGQK